MVGWQSGRLHFFAKEAGPERVLGGSNPSPTAKITKLRLDNPSNSR